MRLVPTEIAAELGVPELRLGSASAGFPEAVTVGSHEENEAVLPLEEAAECHCQFALRSFKLPQHSDKVHEALFLRDVAEDSRTLVNGQPAFRPWQWLQDGDDIGLPCVAANGGSANGALEFYTVRYCNVQMLPRGAADLQAAPHAAPTRSTASAPAAVEVSRKQASAGGGVGSSRTAAVGRRRAGTAAGRSSRKGAAPTLRFTTEVIGEVIDVTYDDPDEPPATYRVKVIGFDPTTGWHTVDSEGYSVWKDEVRGDDSFTDEIDLNKMHANGLIQFVGAKKGPTPQVVGSTKTKTNGSRKRPRGS